MSNNPHREEHKSKKRMLACLSCIVLMLVLFIGAAIAYFLQSDKSQEEQIDEGQQTVPNNQSELLLRNAVPASTLVLVKDKKNYTDAIKYCEQQLQKTLWVPETQNHESMFLLWAAQNIIADCHKSFLGHRLILDKQWHPVDSLQGPFAFGHLSQLTNCISYDWGNEHCLRIENEKLCMMKLTNVPCEILSDCYICQNRNNCLSSNCLDVNINAKVNHDVAKRDCLDNEQTLLFLSNYNELKNLESFLNGPDFQSCKNFILDMTTTPFYETYTEEEVTFLPSFLDFSVKGDHKINDMCLIYDKSHNSVIRESCTSLHCFVCGLNI